ncbi:Endonuclease [Melia azedarach]|uniref:Endonuclease n=1 Tax=Melia azedarach TaxID=155640 RepID=A0ACC1WW50_MELAZ|nr:Endonuclease [Melia azedarach]
MGFSVGEGTVIMLFTRLQRSEGYLRADALVAVKKLLPDSAEGHLANVCSCADEIRRDSHWDWSTPLHFINTPAFKCNYEYCRDCHNSAGHENVCATAAIYNYTEQLKSFNEDSVLVSKYDVSEALMFLSHIMGDMHQ